MTEIVAARLGFGWGYALGEDNWKTGVDQNFRMSDVYHGLSIISDALTAPPGSPVDGDIYIPAATATGAWATYEGKIAAYQDGAWYFYSVTRGLRAEFRNHGDFRHHTGTAWAVDPGAVASVVGATGTVTLADLTAGGVASKTYVDTAIQGLSVKPSATWATAAALAANTYANGTAGLGATLTATGNGALTVDGGGVVAADLVLVKNEATASHNGLYVVTDAGDGSHPYILTRHIDMDTTTEFMGGFIAVESGGAANANTMWLCTVTAAPTVGTTSIPFTELNGATTLAAGTGIIISAGTASIDTAVVAELASPAFTGTPAAPTASVGNTTTQVATTAFATTADQNLAIKPTARVATQSALPACTYSNGTSGVGATLTMTSTGTLTVDGIVTALNDLILVKNQLSTFQNGLYKVTTAGAGGVAAVLTRDVSMNSATKFIGAAVFVGWEGTNNFQSLWLCEALASITVGTTAVQFDQINAGTGLVAGTGIAISGNSIAVNTGVVATVASPSFTGTVHVQEFKVSGSTHTIDLTAAISVLAADPVTSTDSSHAVATTEWVAAYLAATGYAPIGGGAVASVVGFSGTVSLGNLVSGGVATAASPTFTGTVDASGATEVKVPTPSAANDAATKAYVDGVAQGLQIKPTGQWATAAALAANTYNNGTAGVGATLTGNANGAIAVDSGAPALNDVVLVKNEATGANNGLYTVTQVGDGSHPYILTRSIDMDSTAKYLGAFIAVKAGGTANGNSLWMCENTSAPTVGTTAITFTQLNGATDLQAGAQISISGNTITAVPSINSGYVVGNTGTATAQGSAVALTTLWDLNFGSAQGDIVYRNNTTWTALAPGLSGQILQSGGTAANLSWINPIWNAGSVTTVGNGLVLNAGTVSMYNAATLAGTAAGTLTIAPASGTSDVIINMPSAGGTVTVTSSAPAYTRQRMLMEVKQGATFGVLNLGTVFKLTGAVTSFTLTPTASAIDRLEWITPDNTSWVLLAVNQGATL